MTSHFYREEEVKGWEEVPEHRRGSDAEQEP